MIERNHTPAPWVVEKAHSGGAGYRVVSDAPGYPNEGWNVAAEIIGPDKDANAKLIAAAPDMLVALGEIARGRADCGRPLASEKARQLARETLIAHGLSWPSKAEGR